VSGPAKVITGQPWYREPWPWIIIGLLGTVVIASFITLWIAASNPDALVVRDQEYQTIKGELRAQDTDAIRAAQARRAAEDEAASGTATNGEN